LSNYFMLVNFVEPFPVEHEFEPFPVKLSNHFSAPQKYKRKIFGSASPLCTLVRAIDTLTRRYMVPNYYISLPKMDKIETLVVSHAEL
jgi:hypothetical protein